MDFAGDVLQGTILLIRNKEAGQTKKKLAYRKKDKIQGL